MKIAISSTLARQAGLEIIGIPHMDSSGNLILGKDKETGLPIVGEHIIKFNPTDIEESVIRKPEFLIKEIKELAKEILYLSGETKDTVNINPNAGKHYGRTTSGVIDKKRFYELLGMNLDSSPEELIGTAIQWTYKDGKLISIEKINEQ